LVGMACVEAETRDIDIAASPNCALERRRR